MTPNQLVDTATRYQVLLEGLKTSTVNEFTKVFNKVDTVVADLLNALQAEKLNEVTRAKLEATLAALEKAQLEAFSPAIDKFIDEVPEIAKQAAEFEANALRSVATPSGRKRVKTPPAAKAATEALKRPVQATGTLLAPLVDTWARGAVKKTNDAIRLGYTQGKTVPQMLKELRGTGALNYKDGVTAVNKRHAATVLRTAVQHVAATGREVTYEENSDLVKGVEWVSTLDGHTTPQCRGLDGEKFKLQEGPRPPIHPNCRSTTAPDLSEEFDFLDKGATRSAKDGPVDAKETYYSWLAKQDPAFQDKVLGPVRGQLLREGGLTAKQFTDLQLDKNWQPITLAEMKEIEPLAFQRAGLMPGFEVQAKDTSRAKLPGRPGAGTTTGRVWGIADELESSLGRIPTRQEVLAEATKYGINESTVGVQFGKWRKATGSTRLPPAPMPILPPVLIEVPPPPVGLPQPTSAVKNTLTAKEREAKYSSITNAIDMAIGSASSEGETELIRNSRKLLSGYYTRFPDGQGGIHINHPDMDTYSRREISNLLAAIKSKGAPEFNAMKNDAANTTDTRQAIHDVIAGVNRAKIAQPITIAQKLPQLVREKARAATEFLDKIVADKFKTNPVSVKLVTDQEDAAFYVRQNKTVNLTLNGNTTKIYVHELGHHFEYESGRASRSRLIDFVEKRRKSEAWFQHTATNDAYYQDCKVFEDEWASRGGTRYTSRLYGTRQLNADGTPNEEQIRATEVLSSGLERLYADPLDFYRKDREHFDITVRTVLDLL